MNFRAFATAATIAGTLLLTSCAHTLSPSQITASPKKLDCNGSVNCEVVVSVECSTTPCKIKVDADLVLLHNANGQNHITWLIDQREFEFKDNGIVIDPSVFDCSKDGKWKFKCKARKATNDAYKYNVNVVATAGSPPVDPLDPWVVNN